jgi:SAM-dependent methyltransferase
MPGKTATDGSGSKWTRMWWPDDMANGNIRREHLAHVYHYKVNIHDMKREAKTKGRPVNVLDVGCGEANTMRVFYTADQSRKRDVVESYVGIDGDPSVIKRTEERAATIMRGINGRLEVCDITQGRFPVERGTIDLVICNEVLEHIPQKAVKKVLKAMHRCTASDALLLISTPNKDGTNDKLPADHVYEWGYEEIQSAFHEAGFVVEDTLGVYIKKDRLVRWLKENEPDLVEWAEELWLRFGNDIGSMMTADWARPVANNLIWKLRKA